MGDVVESSPAPSEKEEVKGEAETGGGVRGEEDEEEKVLQFLDSLDGYLTLFDSLSSTLRQGWLELAGARHSMGSSRISSVLFDLKEQSAPTTLQMTQLVDGSSLVSGPHFTLSKWASLRGEKCYSKEVEDEELQKKSDGSQLRHRGPSRFPEEVQETNSTIKGSPVTVDNNVQKERAKSLSVFGTLVSPRLRVAQVSFETALETIVEIANLRSTMLSAFSQLQLEKEGMN